MPRKLKALFRTIFEVFVERSKRRAWRGEGQAGLPVEKGRYTILDRFLRL